MIGSKHMDIQCMGIYNYLKMKSLINKQTHGLPNGTAGMGPCKTVSYHKKFF